MSVKGILRWDASSAAEWMPIHPTAIGHVHCQMPVSVGRQDFFALHLVVKGGLRFRPQGQATVLLKEGAVFLTDDRNRCHYQGTTPDTEIFWIRLAGPMVEPYIRSIGLSYEVSYLERPPSAEALRLFSQCFDYVESGSDHWAHSIVAMLYRLAGAIRSGEAPKPVGGVQLARHVRLLMEDELSFHRTIKDFCYAFGVSRSTLYKSFEETYGESPAEVLGQLRHRKSLELLRTSEISFEEVALQSGYSGYLQFVRTFKKLEGTTPSEYRAAGLDT